MPHKYICHFIMLQYLQENIPLQKTLWFTCCNKTRLDAAELRANLDTADVKSLKKQQFGSNTEGEVCS